MELGELPHRPLRGGTRDLAANRFEGFVRHQRDSARRRRRRCRSHEKKQDRVMKDLAGQEPRFAT
jgi:hypothetical protein